MRVRSALPLHASSPHRRRPLLRSRMPARHLRALLTFHMSLPSFHAAHTRSRVTVAEGIPFTPEVFSTKDSSWHPICGHRFWDNDKGATTACVEFGFNSGVVVRTDAIYDSDAVLVGICNEGEALDSCFIDPDWPTIHLSGTSLSCTAGNAVGVDITCFNQR